MAELVDAPDSKSGIGNDVQVRFLFRAQHPFFEGFFYFLKFNTVKHYSDFLSFGYLMIYPSFPNFCYPVVTRVTIFKQNSYLWAIKE